MRRPPAYSSPANNLRRTTPIQWLRSQINQHQEGRTYPPFNKSLYFCPNRKSVCFRFRARGRDGRQKNRK
ncbi:hypothetical protein LINGRAHAP2_LOCUS20408, partial [Linum grandiflorum]